MGCCGSSSSVQVYEDRNEHYVHNVPAPAPALAWQGGGEVHRGVRSSPMAQPSPMFHASPMVQSPPMVQPSPMVQSPWWKEPAQPSVFIARAPAAPKVWKVVKKRLVVRIRSNLKSKRKKIKLKKGAVIEQVKAKGRRIKFRKISGKGPKLGWVSIRSKKGKRFLAKQTPPRLSAREMALVPVSGSTGLPDFHQPPAGPLLSCPEYVQKAIRSMPLVKHGGDLIREAKQTARETASSHAVQMLQSRGISLSMDEIFAIVMYTFDLCLTGRNCRKEDNFFYQLNAILKRQVYGEVATCHGYLYYLMRAMNKLPAFGSDDGDDDSSSSDSDSDGEGSNGSGSDSDDDGGEVFIFRGMRRKERDECFGGYTKGRVIQFPTLTSFSTDEDTAVDFTEGPNGMLIELEIKERGSQFRDIEKLSAFGSAEKEVLSLPNFRAVVKEAPHFDQNVGCWVTSLKEVS